MAYENIPANDPAAVQLYEKEYFQSFHYKTELGLMQEMGCVYLPSEFKERNPGAGDSVLINTFGRATGLPYGENSVIEGNEKGLSRSTFSMSFNETWEATRVPSTQNIKQMRLRTYLKRPSMDQIFDRVTALKNVSAFHQLAGANPTTITYDGTTFTGNNRDFVTGHNTVAAPAASRVYRPGGATNDQSLTSSDTMNCDVLDEIAARINNSLPSFKKAKGGYIIGFFSPRQMLDFRKDAGGAIQWYANALAFAQGGDPDDIRLGSQFGNRGYVYNNFILFESPYVADGVNDSNDAAISTVKRAVFIGGDALFYATPFGGTLDDDEVPLTMVTETFDYKRFDGYAGCDTSGLKTFVGADGVADNVFVAPTYAAAL